MKLRDDGWLKLSPALLRALAVKSGDKLEVELRDGALILRPIDGKAILPEVTVPSPAESVPSDERPPRRRSPA